jgi:hypothetical protein
MADELPEGVESETITWHKADGTPTTNKDEAVTAEVVTVLKGGGVERTIMRRKDAA